MTFFLTMAPRRLMALLLVALAIVVAGTAVAVRYTTDYVLHESTTATARDWANLLAGTVTDLEPIANGEPPSSASLVFFEWARHTGQVFRYEIYNAHGLSQLVADDTVRLVDLSSFSAEAMRAIDTGETVVALKQAAAVGDGVAIAGVPAEFAEAYVPVKIDGRTIAVVAAFVDNTEQQALFQEAFLMIGGTLCALTGLAFGIPAVAWYRRTQEKRGADRRIRYLAHHDVLTGLTNRATMLDRLEIAARGLALSEAQIAVLFIDLDRFKEVNDTFGHDSGDFLLKKVAERLRAAVRRDDVVARFGGDEFVVLLTPVVGPAGVEEFTSRLAVAMAEPVRFADQELAATLSIGVAIGPTDGATAERLLKSADLAVYRAKADGRDCVRFFTPEMDAELMARAIMEKALRHALAHDGFDLHYQPEYEIGGRRLVGFEAFLRLRAEDGRLLSPAEFLPLAEELRLIDRIGAWVLRKACTAAADWPDHLKVAVNISPAQFARGGIGVIVSRVLRETGLPARRLELEISETHLFGDIDAAMQELHALKAMGVAVVMGQFGTGTSSLSYLWRFPFDKIKIDRSFMQGYEGPHTPGRDAETVIRTIIALGRELHMGVTVEGVETVNQMDFLDRVDADRAQGFYFSRPLPIDRISALLQTDAAQRSSRTATA